MNDKVYILSLYDQWFNKSSRIVLGIYTEPEKAMACYKGNYRYDLVENGTNQWFVEKNGTTVHGLEIEEVTLNIGC